MNDKKAVGQRIKSIRLQLGKNQEAFGNLFDPKVSKGGVSRWESGDTIPNAKRLKMIAKWGGVTVSELLHGSIDEMIDDTADYIYSVYLHNFDENSMPKTREVRNIIEKINTHKDTSIYKDQNFVLALSIILTISDDEYDESNYRLNVEQGIKYCSSEVKRKIGEFQSNVFSTSGILSLFRDAADNHVYGYTPDNNGLIAIARDGLNTTLLELANLVGDTDAGVKFPKDVNKDFYKDIVKVFNHANDQITKLATDKYHL